MVRLRRSPRVVQLLEGGDDSRGDLVDQCRIATVERIERHRELAVTSVKENHVIRAVLRHQSQQGHREVAVRVDQTDPSAGGDVGMHLVEQQRRLPHAGLADDLSALGKLKRSASRQVTFVDVSFSTAGRKKVPATIFLREADDAAVLAESNLADDDRPRLSS